MDSPNFDPVIGEEVRVRNRPGIFKIIGVHASNGQQEQSNPLNAYGRLGLPTVDLKPERKGPDLAFVPWDSLEYADEARPVRRTIDWLKSNPEGHEYPGYIVDYEVELGHDHLGNPSIFVRFFVDPDYFYQNGHASKEKVIALNHFLDSVRDELHDLELNKWISVRAGEKRRELSVAS